MGHAGHAGAKGASQPAARAGGKDSLARVAEGLRWALGVLAVLQAVFPSALPPLLPAWIAEPAIRGGPFLASGGPLVRIGMIPWLVYAGMQVAHARLLRRAGPFPFSDAEVMGMALVPFYNVYGSYRLFAEAAAGAERVGSSRRLAFEVRAGAVASLVLSAALALVSLWILSWHLPGNVGPPDGLAATFETLVTILLVVARLHLLWRLHTAMEAVAKRPARACEEAVTPRAAPFGAGATCPDCGERDLLERSASELSELVCRACGGALLDSSAVIGLEILLASGGVTGAAPASPQPIPGGRQSPCAACGAPASRVRLAAAGGWSCPSCGALWLPAAGLHRITRGQCGVPPGTVPARAGAPGGPLSSPARTRAVAAAVAALAVAGLAGGLREARSAYRKASLPFAVSLEPGLHELSEQRARELRLEGRAPAAAPAQPGAGTFVTSGARYQASRLSASGPQTGSVPVPVADVALPAPARPPPRETRLAAGRPVEWWRDRLRLLATRSDEEGRRLLALTRERAVANGLEVVDGALGAEVRFAAKVVGP